MTFGLYDDFDGNGGEQTYDGSQLAVAGSLSGQLWRHLASEDVSVVDLTSIIGDSVSYGANPSGNIVKMVNTSGGDMRLEVVHPMKINFADYQSFSADVMLKDTGADDFSLALDYHTSIPEQPPGISWYCQIKLRKDRNTNTIYIVGQLTNKNTGFQTYEILESAELNTWYNLKMDITKLNESEVKVDFFINNILKYSEIPPDSEILLDPSRLAFGPIRSIQLVGKDISSQNQINANIDNVECIFKNRIQ